LAAAALRFVIYPTRPMNLKATAPGFFVRARQDGENRTCRYCFFIVQALFFIVIADLS
jgi:hypothetical protein